MIARLVAVVLLSSAVAACSCDGINSFPDHPIGMGKGRGKVRINDSVVQLFAPDPIVVSGLQVWINYEPSETFSGQRLARIEVENSQGNRKVIPGTIISYSNEKIFKSTGPVELSGHMTSGINTVTFFVTNGVSGNVRLRGIVDAKGKPAGAIVPQCFESTNAASESVFAFKVDYRPTAAKNKRQAGLKQ